MHSFDRECVVRRKAIQGLDPRKCGDLTLVDCFGIQGHATCNNDGFGRAIAQAVEEAILERIWSFPPLAAPLAELTLLRKSLLFAELSAITHIADEACYGAALRHASSDGPQQSESFGCNE